DDGVAVARDQINLPPRRTVAAHENAQPLAPQPAGSLALAAIAQNTPPESADEAIHRKPLQDPARSDPTPASADSILPDSQTLFDLPRLAAQGAGNARGLEEALRLVRLLGLGRHVVGLPGTPKLFMNVAADEKQESQGGHEDGAQPKNAALHDITPSRPCEW